MKKSSATLTKEFEDLFKQQNEIEESEEFQNKRRKHDNINLEIKHNLNTLSEIFQDADLLSKISKEAHTIMRATAERPSRARYEQDLLTFKKPQAKDVNTTRKINDDLEDIYEILENMINDETEFINPLAPKRRKYYGESEAILSDQSNMLIANPPTASPSQSSSDFSCIPSIDLTKSIQSEEDLGHSDAQINQLIEPENDTTESQPQPVSFEEPSTTVSNSTNTTPLANENKGIDILTTEGRGDREVLIDSLLEPAQDIPKDLDHELMLALSDLPSVVNQPTDNSQNQPKEKSELEILFEETSKLIAQSPLQTVGSKHLYTCLPRQGEPNAFMYVKEDYTPTKAKNSESDQSSVLDDTLITVLVFNPTNSNLKFQQIEILGSQTISDIRDAIHCQTDFSHNNDRKDSHVDGEILNTFEKKISASFIYADHVFYVDTRYQDFTLEQYNDLLESWMAKNGVNRKVFQFSKKHMHQSILEPIEFELHRPFAFVHQGTCEHVMMIIDMRLISPDEYKSKEEFPRTTHNLRYDRFKCSMCTIYPASKVTYDDVISGLSPCYFCEVCYESFHHNPSDVQVFEYYGTPGGDINRRYLTKKKT